jgi:cytochrome c6
VTCGDFPSTRKASAEGEETLMTTKWLTRIALFSFLFALALPPTAVAQAADTYKAKCAGCHGADGSKSMMGAKPLNGAEVQGMSDADLTAAITDGKGKMPAYKGKLTDAQIKDLVSYIRTLKK